MNRRDFLGLTGTSLSAIGLELSPALLRHTCAYPSQNVQIMCSPLVPIINELVTIWPVVATGGNPRDEEVFGDPNARSTTVGDQNIRWRVDRQDTAVYGPLIRYRFAGGDHLVEYYSVRQGRPVAGAITITVALAPESYYNDPLPLTSLLPAVPNRVLSPRLIIGFTGAAGSASTIFSGTSETGDSGFFNNISRMVTYRAGDERGSYTTTKNMPQTHGVIEIAVNWIAAKARTRPYNVVLIGFSRGGFAAISTAGWLQRLGIYVSYLGTIDVVDYMGISGYPTQAWQLPGNVIRARNIRQLHPNDAHGAYVRRAANFYLYPRQYYWTNPQTGVTYNRPLGHSFISDYPPVQLAIADDINRLT